MTATIGQTRDAVARGGYGRETQYVYNTALPVIYTCRIPITYPVTRGYHPVVRLSTQSDPGRSASPCRAL